MAREAGSQEYGPLTRNWSFELTQLKAFEALVRADERGSKPHSLGPGEMELSLRREHNGELFEYRHRFSAEQVMHGPIFMVTDAAKRMDDEIDAAIRARGNT
jgi:hypothetical protein